MKFNFKIQKYQTQAVDSLVKYRLKTIRKVL